jgi:hypothetical protein
MEPAPWATQLRLCSYIKHLGGYPAENNGKGGEMIVTLSKFLPANWEFNGQATDGLRSRALSPIDGFLEEEIKVILLTGGCR